jgi:protein-disulfide isomerase
LSGLHGRRLRLAAGFGTAAALAAVLVGASLIGSRDEGSAPAPVTAPEQERSLFAGIEQNGPALGSPRATLTLVEYADLQCPYCAQWARDALPTLVEDYVRLGVLRIVFHGLAFLGPDSDKALRTAVAAGREDHLWDVVHGLYLSQGAENAGWVTDELVAGIAKGVPGLEPEALLRARWEGSLDAELRRFAKAAEAAGVRGTPAFQLGPTGGRLELVRIDSLGPEGIASAIERALAR